MQYRDTKDDIAILDICEVFDTVPHKELLYTME